MHKMTGRSTSVPEWEALTPGRAVEVQKAWGLIRAQRVTGPVPRRPKPVVNAHAECPEHGQTWACGCGGCENALSERYGA